MQQPPHTSRREFLAGSLVSLGALPHLPLRTLARLGETDVGRATDQEAWVARARDQIPAVAESAYFQTGGIGPAPRVVMEEVKERLDFQNRGPADPRFAGTVAEIEPELRAYLARTFGANSSEVALTHSTSEGISIAAWSLNWAPGDEVIISNQEHPANVVPWYVLRDRFGIVIREIDLDAGTHLIDQVRSRLTSRTRMVSISHVSRNNGRRIRTGESAELGAILRQRGVRYHLDGAQGPGCVPVDFHALGCDCYSTCGHKWLLGPKGTGALFVRQDRLDETHLSWAGAHSHASMDYTGQLTLKPSAARYEFGTRALADFAGFHRAIRWMEEMGLERIERRVEDLVQYAVERTKEHATLGIASPETPEDRSGVFVIRLPLGCDPLGVYQRLAADQGILTSPVRQERDLRIAIHFFNTRDEIDDALDAVNAIC